MIQERLQQYFRSKARQLSAAADQSICDHTTLSGSHREEIQRIYLRDILPKRFEVGRGMVYGPAHRSKEADIVIWDSQNYPSLPMYDHSFFFAESVKAVLECKSNWSTEEFKDVLNKCRAVRDIVTIPNPNLADDIILIKQELTAIRQQRDDFSLLIIPHHIATAAIFLKGGHLFSPTYLTNEDLQEIDDAWPDILLLLEVGRVVIKNYEPVGSQTFGGHGWLEFYDLQEDGLLAFTTALLALLTDRSVQIEDPLDLTQYAPSLLKVDPVQIDFPLTRPIPRRIPLMGTDDESAPRGT